jgi:outer membrane protein insertion porin family
MLAVLVALLNPWSSALAQTEPFVIQDIRVEGLQRISPGSVFAALPVGVGDTVDIYAVRAAAKSLFASGNFDDISIARDGGVLVVVVAERPSISEITIDGNISHRNGSTA